MDILLKILQFAALYFVIGTVFTAMVIHIYEKYYNNASTYEKYLGIMSNTKTRLQLVLILIGSWPYFAFVFLRAIGIGTIEVFKNYSNKEDKNER